MNNLWGQINNRQEIELCLKKYFPRIGLVASSFEFKHLKSGFTDNVFLVQAMTGNIEVPPALIVKEYLQDWHQKEADIYKNILGKNSFLGGPKLIIKRQNFIVLEFLSPNEIKPLSKLNIDILKDWIVKKHIYFCDNLILDQFTENEEVQIHYLVDKPLITLKNILGGSEKLEIILSNKDTFLSTIKLNNQLPQTLEHGDLESQNLFIDSNNKLRVIDWVNARRGSGLFDINQFMETTEELGFTLDRELFIKDISKKIRFDDLGIALSKTRQLMLLNKINFYGSKYLNGELESHSKLKPVMTLFEKYLDELLTNIKQIN